jgi:hypothetical protein
LGTGASYAAAHAGVGGEARQPGNDTTTRAEVSGFSTQQQLLRDCHELSVACGVEAILVFVIDTEVHCWSSPALEGLVTDHASRQVLKSLLLEPPSSKERQESLALYLSGKEVDDNFPGINVEEEERKVDFIGEVEVREKRFKTLVAHIYTEAEAICKLKSPLSDKCYNYLFVVAVHSGKIFPFSSPELKPLIATEHGRNLIGALLETNLKSMAEEADPEAAAREAAAIERAKQKMLRDE